MATYDSTVRLRQLNKPELSGYILEVIGEIPNTGNLTGEFYPLNSNPSSYITTSQTGNFITQIDLDSNYYSTLIYVGNNYYPLNNPSGYISTSGSSFVYATGNQNISGVKNFYSRPTVNGVGVLLSGEAAGGNVNLQNVVYTTGNQTISGNKIFANDLISTSNFGVYDNGNARYSIFYINGSQLYLQGDYLAKINFYDVTYITGFDNIYGTNIYQNGVKVATLNDLSSVVGLDIQNIVYKTGDQDISGIKSFYSRPKVNGTGVLLSGEAGNITITGIGSGNQIYSGYTDGNYNFRSISGGTGINISLSNDQKVLNLNTTGLVTVDKTGDFLTNSSNVFFLTGDQSASGEKRFLNKLKIGTGSFRGVFDVDKVINDFELPIPQNATLQFPLGQFYSYSIENSNFFFYLYGYKDVQGDRVYSSPAMLEGQSPSSLGFNLYQLELSWTTNSIYDGYYIQVYNDPQLGILNGVPSSGILIQNNSTSTINIGEIQLFGPGYVTQTTSYYQSINTIGYPNLFSKKLSPELFLETGFNNRIVLNSNSIQVSGQTSFNKRPTVNGSGVLLSGEVIGNNVNIQNVVYTTGDQTINGRKVFSEVLTTNVLKTDWVITDDPFESQINTDSNFIGYNAGIQDNSATNYYVNYIGYNAGQNSAGVNDNSNILGNSAGQNASDFESSNFIGNGAGLNSIGTNNSNLIGTLAGSNSITNYSNFIGYYAGFNSNSCVYSNFIGYSAGNDSTNSFISNFIGQGAGYGTTNCSRSNFIGFNAGFNAQNSTYSTFIGYSAGSSSNGLANTILIGNYTSGKSNSIAIGQGAGNNANRQLNVGNVIYATNIKDSNTTSSNPISSGKVGILIDNPQYTLDVSGDCRITGQTVFAIRPTVNGSGVLLDGEGGGPSSDISIYQIRFFT